MVDGETVVKRLSVACALIPRSPPTTPPSSVACVEYLHTPLLPLCIPMCLWLHTRKGHMLWRPRFVLCRLIETDMRIHARRVLWSIVSCSTHPSIYYPRPRGMKSRCVEISTGSVLYSVLGYGNPGRIVWCSVFLSVYSGIVFRFSYGEIYSVCCTTYHTIPYHSNPLTSNPTIPAHLIRRYSNQPLLSPPLSPYLLGSQAALPYHSIHTIANQTKRIHTKHPPTLHPSAFSIPLPPAITYPTRLGQSHRTAVTPLAAHSLIHSFISIAVVQSEGGTDAVSDARIR